MLPKGLVYPATWPAMYIAKDKKQYACYVAKAHLDDIEPYYTVCVLEGPYAGERQTVGERLTSWVDTHSRENIKKILSDYERDVMQPCQSQRVQ